MGTGAWIRHVMTQNMWLYPNTSDRNALGQYYKGLSYLETLNHCKFCLIIQGVNMVGSREHEVRYMGCIPVYIMIQSSLVLQTIIDYEKLGIVVPVELIGDIE